MRWWSVWWAVWQHAESQTLYKLYVWHTLLYLRVPEDRIPFVPTVLRFSVRHSGTEGPSPWRHLLVADFAQKILHGEQEEEINKGGPRSRPPRECYLPAADRLSACSLPNARASREASWLGSEGVTLGVKGDRQVVAAGGKCNDVQLQTEAQVNNAQGGGELDCVQDPEHWRRLKTPISTNNSLATPV